MRIINYSDLLLPENVAEIAIIVKNGDVVVYPTDTLYGLGGNFFAPAVSAKIDLLKQRQDMPYSVAVANIAMLTQLVATVPPLFYTLYDSLLPGKFTFLFNTAASCIHLNKNQSKIGIRIPNAPSLLALLGELQVPFISTSVNKSGEPPINDPAAILQEFAASPTPDRPALFIDNGILPPSSGSTILDLTETPIRCIRKGDDFDKWLSFAHLHQPESLH